MDEEEWLDINSEKDNALSLFDEKIYLKIDGLNKFKKNKK
jgi:hypothetical protein